MSDIMLIEIYKKLLEEIPEDILVIRYRQICLEHPAILFNQAFKETNFFQTLGDSEFDSLLSQCEKLGVVYRDKPFLSVMGLAQYVYTYALVFDGEYEFFMKSLISKIVSFCEPFKSYISPYPENFKLNNDDCSLVPDLDPLGIADYKEDKEPVKKVADDDSVVLNAHGYNFVPKNSSESIEDEDFHEESEEFENYVPEDYSDLSEESISEKFDDLAEPNEDSDVEYNEKSKK